MGNYTPEEREEAERDVQRLRQHKHFWSNRVPDAQPQWGRIDYSVNRADSMIQIDHYIIDFSHGKWNQDPDFNHLCELVNSTPHTYAVGLGVGFQLTEEIKVTFTKVYQKQLDPPMHRWTTPQGTVDLDDLVNTFNSNSDCYVDTKDDSVVLAMSLETFQVVVNRLLKITNNERARELSRLRVDAAAGVAAWSGIDESTCQYHAGKLELIQTLQGHHESTD